MWGFIDLYFIEDGDFKEDILFYFSIIAIFYSNLLKRQVFIDFICFLYVLYFILETTSYMAISSNFSSSYMFVLIESNKAELSEFTTSYINIPIIVFISIMIVLFFVIRKLRLFVKTPKRTIIGSLVFFAIVLFLKGTGLIESNAYHNIVRGTYGYFELQNSVKFNSEILKEDIQIKTDNEILVVVLGESTTSQHMQLYNYNRETTPLLNSIRDSLFIYNNVISTDVITTKSLPKMLTSIDNRSKKNISTNIINVFNSAGYKTYWLSNQRPIGFYDNQISTIASISNFLKFYNHESEVKTTSYDEVLIPDFNSVLNEDGKKAIFLRLIGTHFDYNNRYPPNFNNFFSNTKTPKKVKIINDYDNAVLYNDFVVYSFIKELQKQNKKSALIYLSDHGENLYHEGTDFFGRSETVLTKSMFKIPFIVWLSKDFEMPSDFEYKPNRAFMADHTYESIGHLFGVLYKDMDSHKSIFSNTFKERKRKVMDTINYDLYFSEKHE
ncbi:phosphoethanolamine transferase [Yeosuana sp. AK3]